MSDCSCYCDAVRTGGQWQDIRFDLEIVTMSRAVLHPIERLAPGVSILPAMHTMCKLGIFKTGRGSLDS